MVFVMVLNFSTPAGAIETKKDNDTNKIVSVYDSVVEVINLLNNKYHEKIEKESEIIRIRRREASIEKKEKILSLNPVKSVPLYNQLDYANVEYGCCGTVASHGCGITSLAMVSTYLLDTDITPDELAIKFGKYNTEKGSAWVLFEDSAKVLRLNLQERTSSTKKVIEALENNQVVIALQKPGLFTTGGHFIVLVGLTEDGKIIVNDPNGANYTKNRTLINGFKNGFNESDVFENGGPYWIYGRKDAKKIEYSIAESVR